MEVRHLYIYKIYIILYSTVYIGSPVSNDIQRRNLLKRNIGECFVYKTFRQFSHNRNRIIISNTLYMWTDEISMTKRTIRNDEKV